MHIVTLSEIKSLMQIEGTSKDALITMLIPMIQSFVNDFTNNYFTDPDICITGDSLTFVTGDPATITDEREGFEAAGFMPEMLVYVDGTFFNDGYYKISTVEPGTLTLATGETLVNESPSKYRPVDVVRAKIPEAIKLAMAKIIGYEISEKKDVQAESVGTYSVTFKNNSNAGKAYPENIINALKPYRKIKFGD